MLTTENNIVCTDLGPYSEDSVDYPDYAAKLCEAVLEKSDK